MAKRLFTSESVTEGHPDKICDQISDAVLDAIFEKRPQWPRGLRDLRLHRPDPHHGRDHHQLLRGHPQDRPPGGAGHRLRPLPVRLRRQHLRRHHQHRRAVRRHRPGRGQGAGPRPRATTSWYNGAGDQGMMFGYACDETPELMPWPSPLAHKMAQAPDRRAEKQGLWTTSAPDGKTQITVEYDESGKPPCDDTVVLSTQHGPEVSLRPDPQGHDRAGHQAHRPRRPHGRWRRRSRQPHGAVCQAARSRHRPDGPQDHRGHLRRQRPHGGGAFSGKDPTKVDRSAAYAARWAAKNVVAAGLPTAPGAAGLRHRRGPSCQRTGGDPARGVVSDTELEAAVEKVFDLRPTAIIRDLDLRKPIYRQLAAYGHMGARSWAWPGRRPDRGRPQGRPGQVNMQRGRPCRPLSAIMKGAFPCKHP